MENLDGNLDKTENTHNEQIKKVAIPLDDLRKHLAKIEQLSEKVDELTKLNVVDETSSVIKKDLETYKELRKKSGVNIEYLNEEYKKEIFEPRKSNGPYYLKVLTKEEIELALKNNTSARKAARSLGVSYPTFKKYARIHKIDYAKGWINSKMCVRTYVQVPEDMPEGTYTHRKPTSPFKGRFPLEKVLDCKYPRYPIHRLKDKLIRAKLKNVECEICGFSERRITDGKPPLLLLFNDGDHTNHKLSNLKIVCYNCGFLMGAYIHNGERYFDPEVLQGSKKLLHQRF